MSDLPDPKAMAKRLRKALSGRGTEVTHSQALDLVAAQLGHSDWNTLAANPERTAPPSTLTVRETAPVLRIFDEAKAKEFYLDFLGFSLQFEHRFGDDFPLYAGVARDGLVLHLSGHHGDATPGAAVFVRVAGIDAYHREIRATSYPNMRPGIEEQPWGRVMSVTDPFQNRIHFCEDPGNKSG